MSAPQLVEHEEPLTIERLLDPRRWIALAIVATAQLMVALDATIANIALPHAQAALGISDSDRAWVLTAYALAFGGLLLLGGRIADYWGRKRTFLLGSLGFALASALGGFAQDAGTLFAARALQGAFGALLAPASLALLTVLFIEPRERAKAFGIYGAIAGGGAAVGLILGGVLTEYLDWRWCLLVNIPIAILAGGLALKYVTESRAHGRTKYDVGGAVLVTLGLAGLVYGFTTAAEPDYGWGSSYTLSFIIVSLLFLAGFVIEELRAENPLLPLRIVLHRDRGGSMLASLLAGAGLFGSSLFMTYYFQQVLHYTPLHAGLATLPITGGILLAFPLATMLLTRVGAWPVMATGAFVAAGGLLLFTRIGTTDHFWTDAFPATLVFGAGLGMLLIPMSNVALTGVNPRDAGAAGAVMNATQQIGGSLGAAALSSIALQAANSYLAEHWENMPATIVEDTMVHSFRVGFAWAAAFLGVAGIVVLALVRAGKIDTKNAPVHFG